MKKRTFLKLSSAIAAGVVLAPFASCIETPKERLKNWAGNLTYSTAKVVYPKFDDFVKLVKEYDPQGKFHNKFLDIIMA
jgi:alditol oxidase